MVPWMNVAAEKDWENVMVCLLHILPCLSPCLFPSESSLLACLPEGAHVCCNCRRTSDYTRLEALTVQICQDGTAQRARKETLVAFGGEAVQEGEVVGITSMMHYFG